MCFFGVCTSVCLGIGKFSVNGAQQFVGVISAMRCAASGMSELRPLGWFSCWCLRLIIGAPREASWRLVMVWRPWF